MTPRPLISVLMLTRNHAPFITEAIASVQAQTSWSALELLVGDDASCDGTTALVAAAARAHPGRIRAWFSPGGAVGFQRNFARLLEAARAPFVALLEGDDWWCDPTKLADQVALLQANPELAFCGARTRLWPDPGEIGPPPGVRRLGFAELVSAYSFHTSSVLLRRQAISLPPWLRNQYCLDRPLYLLAACHGDAGVLDRVVSVYRQHPGGVWSSLTPLQQARRSTALFAAMERAFGAPRAPLFRRAIGPILADQLQRALVQRRARQALAILLLLWRSGAWEPGWRWWAAASRRLLLLPLQP
jgi:glycosyltransferase involved in cell wall biosynthesis